MQPHRITELLRPFLSAPLGAHELESISTYIDILLRWNARVNLTAIRHPEQIVTRHFGESLFAAERLFSPPAARDASAGKQPAGKPSAALERSGAAFPTRLIDFGSGAGFPGIPIKIHLPHTHVTLIESNQKKATFLREVIRALTLTDVNVFADRAENFQDVGDIVTLRAVERFQNALPMAARLVAPAGRLALLIGRSQINSVRDLAPPFSWLEPILVPASANRVLLLGERN
jgi:16S rRNA (guanine527-N7)-methyltransferase